MTDEIKNDGGPAFPMPGMTGLPNGEFVYGEHGMTLRDYLASKAVQGLLANAGGPVQTNGRTGWGLVNCDEADIASMAYRIADAMLAARGGT
jgi:hypothetical protein